MGKKNLAKRDTNNKGWDTKPTKKWSGSSFFVFGVELGIIFIPLYKRRHRLAFITLGHSLLLVVLLYVVVVGGSCSMASSHKK